MDIALIKKMGEIVAIRKQLAERYGRIYHAANGSSDDKGQQWHTETLSGIERLTAEAKELLAVLVTLESELVALNPPQTQPSKKAR
jgi:hypothetical protein